MNAQLSGELLSLSNRVDDLSRRIGSGSNGFVAPIGLTAVSSDPQDPSLLAEGYAPFTSMPSPG